MKALKTNTITFENRSLDKKVPSLVDMDEGLMQASLRTNKLESQLEARQKKEEYHKSIRKLEFEMKSNTPSELDRLEVSDMPRDAISLADVENVINKFPTASVAQGYAVSPETCMKLPTRTG